MPFHFSKKVLSIAAFSLVAATSYAQQLPVMNHYIYNPYLLNPARAGEKETGSISLNFKKQWVNMPNSPITGALLAEGPMGDSRLGFGGMIYSDKMHVLSKIGGMASVAYHLPLADRHRLSGGISLGALNQRLSVSDAHVENPNDPQLIPSANTGTTVDFSIGLNYSLDNKLNIGLSMLQGLGNNIKYLNVNNGTYTDYSLSRHFLATASYTGIEMGEFGFTPTVLGRFIQGLPIQAEVNLLFDWKKFLYLGVGYRSSNTNTATSAMMATFGVQVKERLFFAYTADFGINAKQNASLGSQHEVMVTYRFGKQNNKAQEEQMKAIAEQLEQSKIDQQIIEKRLSENIQRTETLEKQNVQFIEEQKTINNQLTQQLAAQEALNQEQQVMLDKHEEELKEIRKKLDNRASEYKRMGSIQFAEGKSELTTATIKELEAMLPTLKEHANSTIYLYGRASTKGNMETNQRLSLQRAVAVRQYMLSKGLNNIQLIPVGASDPSNGTNQDNPDDRRVDIYIK